MHVTAPAWRPPAYAIAALLVCAATAHAAPVSMPVKWEAADPDGKVSYQRPDIQYAAGPGEANALQIALLGTVSTLTDVVALAAGENCAAASATQVSCDTSMVPFSKDGGASGLNFVVAVPTSLIALGDLDDTLTVSGTPEGPIDDGSSDGISSYHRDFILTADGGAGDDSLTGGIERDELDGADGNDRVSGADSDDTLTGGEGGDTLSGDAGADELRAAERTPVPDVYDGGSDGDTVSYEGARYDVKVELGNPGSGGVRDEDVLRGIEAVVGGLGDDTITGTNRADGLTGGRGEDRLDGGAGDDVLTGGEGRDTIRGGAGNDDIFSGSDGFGADKVTCGSGTDTARPQHIDEGGYLRRTPAGRRVDEIARDCEWVDVGDQDSGKPRMHPYPALRRAGARFTVPCPLPHGCRGTVTVTRAGSKRGSVGRLHSRKGGTAVVTVPLRGRLRHGLVRVDVRVILDSGRFSDEVASYEIRLP